MDRRSFLSALAAACVATPTAAQRVAPQTAADLSFPLKIAAGAEAQHGVTRIYDPAYVRLDFPMGDVPIERGVCSDVVVRAWRAAGVDLQAEVNADMRENFIAYPQVWGLTRPDRNIDHRRVLNLEAFFARKGGSRQPSRQAADYAPGDVISWRLNGTGLPHMGVVIRAGLHTAPVIAHNIGSGVQLQRCLFDWPMAGWYRFDTWTPADL